ncbi:MAG: hypothetical protein ACJ8F0_16345 [Xanthobacteraceae bacterium]
MAHLGAERLQGIVYGDHTDPMAPIRPPSPIPFIPNIGRRQNF